MKKLIVFVSVLLMFSVTSAFADYTIDLKDENNDIVKTYTVTTEQVQHLQKVASVTGKSVINQIKEAILDIVSQARVSNKARWQADNDAYIDGQSRL
jgi:hypothetical protein